MWVCRRDRERERETETVCSWANYAMHNLNYILYPKHMHIALDTKETVAIVCFISVVFCSKYYYYTGKWDQ